MLTEIIFLLDSSGSMSGLVSDTIGGFNSMIDKQKKETGEALISTVLFDTKTKVIHDRVAIKAVEKMTQADYLPLGSTALLDAIGSSIKHIQNIHKYIRNEDVPHKTLFIITTDGMENASKHYNYESIKSLIEYQTKTFGWEFLFLGANIDATQEAHRFGIDESRAANYHSDSEGTNLNYDVLSETITSLRQTSKLDVSWKKRIDKDFKNRK